MSGELTPGPHSPESAADVKETLPSWVYKISPGWLHRWAVVQDLRPHGYLILDTRPVKFLADRVAHGSMYRSVMPTEEAQAYNIRSIEDQAFFESELSLKIGRPTSPEWLEPASPSN